MTKQEQDYIEQVDWYCNMWKAERAKYAEGQKKVQKLPEDEAVQKIEHCKIYYREKSFVWAGMLQSKFGYDIQAAKFLTDCSRVVKDVESCGDFFKDRIQYYWHYGTMLFYYNIFDECQQQGLSASDTLYKAERSVFTFWEWFYPNLTIWNFMDMGRQAGKHDAHEGAVKSLAGWEAAGLKIYPALKEAIRREYPGNLQQGLLWSIIVEAVTHTNDLALHSPTSDGFKKLRTQAGSAIERSNGREVNTDYLKEAEPASQDAAILAFENAEQLLYIVKAASLSPNEREIMLLLLTNPDLNRYGGNKELSEMVSRSVEQVRVEKSNAIKKCRAVMSKDAA